MNAEALLLPLLATSVKGSLVLAFVLTAGLLWRTAIPPRWMHLLLLIGVIRLLLPVAPASTLSAFNLADGFDSPRRVVVVEAPPRAMPRTTASAAVSRDRATDGPNPFLPLVATVWAAGVAIVALRTLRHSLRTRHELLKAEVVGRADAASQLLDECRAVCGVKRRVRLVVTPVVAAPAVHGFWRPTILLPADWNHTLASEQLRFVFLHELAHIRRFDVLVNWVTATAHALHWFNPLVRIAINRLAEERELACDALALEHLAASERRAYGGTVLHLASQWRLYEPVPAIAGMSSTKQPIKRRIQMIQAFRHEKRSALWLVVVAVLAVASLTDARAGEPHKVYVRATSPEASAITERLEQAVTFDLTSASLQDVLHALANHTGVRVTIAEGAMDEEAAGTRIGVDADAIPAHLVLHEVAGALDLSVRFTETGAEIVPRQEGHDAIELRVLDRAGQEAGQVKRVIIRKNAGEALDEEIETRAHEAHELRIARKQIEVKATAENAGAGVSRRKVVYRGGEEGQAEGTLQLEVRRANAS